MPALEFSDQPVTSVDADVVAVFATKAAGDSASGDTPARPARAVLGVDAAAAGRDLGIDLEAELAAIRFEGELGSVARVPTRGKARAVLLLVVGLGKAGKVTLETLRRGAGVAARNGLRDASVALVVPGDLPDGENGSPDARSRTRAVGEGAGLGAYTFTTYRTKTDDLPSIERVLVLAGEGLDGGAVAEGVTLAAKVVTATCLVRDLVNEPPAGKRPPALAARMAEAAQAAGLRVKVWDEQALAEGGFGGILGVGQGSSEPPRLVELTYEPEGASRHVVLVGKGITFDSGGLSLKPSQAMVTMKSDMSGAAAVVGAMTAAATLELRVRVTGLVALAENMPSGHAIRVSDVLTHRGGKTVEVMNTDAEGRLVLADALAYGAESKPDAMIDLATLTGAQIVALGSRIAGLMGSDDGLVDALRGAAEEAGERIWPLPLPDDYAEWLRSEVADLKNIGKGREAGTIIGGLYLKEFTAEVPWAHLDIAGPAFAEDGDAFYTPRGATGFGVRTLVAYFTRLAGDGSGEDSAAGS